MVVYSTLTSNSPSPVPYHTWCLSWPYLVARSPKQQKQEFPCFGFVSLISSSRTVQFLIKTTPLLLTAFISLRTEARDRACFPAWITPFLSTWGWWSLCTEQSRSEATDRPLASLPISFLRVGTMMEQYRIHFHTMRPISRNLFIGQYGDLMTSFLGIPFVVYICCSLLQGKHSS